MADGMEDIPGTDWIGTLGLIVPIDGGGPESTVDDAVSMLGDWLAGFTDEGMTSVREALVG